MHVERHLLKTIVIADYPDKIQVAKFRRAIPYVSVSSLTKGKKDIPTRFRNPKRYYFDDNGVLINRTTGRAQLANAKTAGKARYWVINFQDIWNQSITRQNRATKIEKLKALLRPHIESLVPINEYPLKLEIYFFDVECPLDIFNKGAVYIKVIEDLLVNTNKGKDSNKKIIEDDSIAYLNDSGRCKFIRIQENSERRMEIRIYKSDNIDH